jgi:Methyltransferase domain
MLARAEARASNRTLTLRQMSAEQLVFASASFDAVIMSCVLTVVEDPQQTLAEAARGSRSHPVAHQGDWPHPLRITHHESALAVDIFRLERTQSTSLTH